MTVSDYVGAEEAQVRNHVVALCCMLFVTGVLLWPVLNNDWVNYDDNGYVLENELIRDFDLVQFFKTKQVAGNYHPITLASLSLDYQLFGLNAHAFHRTNLIIHLLSVVLMYVFFVKLKLHWLYATFCAAVFAIHPLHLEPVAWVSSRKDVLSIFFSCLALITLISASAHKRPAILFALTFGFFVLAVLSKATAVSLLLLFFVFDRYQGKLPILKSVMLRSPLILVAFFLAYLAFQAQEGGGAFDAQTETSWLSNLGLSGLALVEYLEMFIWPMKSAAFHPIGDYGSLHFVFGTLVFFIALALFVWLAMNHSNQKLFIGYALFFLPLLPVLHLVSYSDALIAERYSYLSYTGLALMSAEGLRHCFLRLTKIPYSPSVKLFFLGLVISFFGSITHMNTGHWQNGERLWSRVIEVHPDHYFAWGNRGSYFASIGQFEQSILDFNRCILLEPSFAPALNNRGNSYWKLGQLQKAAADFARAVDIDPEELLYKLNRASLAVEMKQYDLAFHLLKQVLRYEPENERAKSIYSALQLLVDDNREVSND